MAYEGGRSITGPFLGSLGASATVVGIVAGIGELLGYSLRSISGYFSDKTHRYWIFTFLGYVTNTLAVPALALAGNWPLAAALIVAERTGRAIRKPAVDAMISYAGKSIGRGWVFGLNEALDQAGATISPLIVALVLYFKGGYRTGFAVLVVPALLCLATLTVARVWHPRPHEMEKRPAHFLKSSGFPKAFWIYTAGGALIAAGLAGKKSPFGAIGRLRRFRLDSVSLSESREHFSKHDSNFLCARDGHQRIDVFVVRTPPGSNWYFNNWNSVFHQRDVCTFGFSRPVLVGARWHGLLGSWHGGAGFAAQSSLS